MRPFHFGSVKSQIDSGQFVFGDVFGAVDDYSGTAGDSDPLVIRIARPGRRSVVDVF